MARHCLEHVQECRNIAIEINGPARDVEAGRPFLFRAHPPRYAGGQRSDRRRRGHRLDGRLRCRFRKYLLLSNRTSHVFDAEALLSMKPVETTAIGDELGPYARVQAIGLTRWCEHMCRERRSYCRSLPTKMVSTASSWDVSQTVAMEACATRTIGADTFLLINPRFVKPFVKEFWR